MANTYIKLDNDYKLVSSSVAVSPTYDLKGYLNLVDNVLAGTQATVAPQTSNWYIVQNPSSGYFLLSAFVYSNTGDYFVTGFNLRDSTGKYTLFFNKKIDDTLTVYLIWGKIIKMIPNSNE